MNADEIVAALGSDDDALRRSAVEEAMARPDEVAEPLLEIVREIAAAPAKILDAEDHCLGHFLALYLLAQSRETRACPLVIDALSLPGVDMDELFGDLMIEDMARILASVSGGDTGAIRPLIENPEADVLARASALDALFCLVYSEVRERGEMVGYLGELFRGKLERRPSKVWTALVRTASNLGPEELYDEVRKAYTEGLLAGRSIDFLMEEVDDNLYYGREMGSPQIADTGAHFLIENTLREIGGYPCFRLSVDASPPASQSLPQVDWSTLAEPPLSDIIGK